MRYKFFINNVIYLSFTKGAVTVFYKVFLYINSAFLEEDSSEYIHILYY